MRVRRLFASRAFAAAAVLLAGVVPAAAQATQARNPCRDTTDFDQPSHCEVRELAVPIVGDGLTVDATPNGGITVRGWDRHEIQLQAKVSASADTVEQAKALAAQVRVLTDGGRLRAEGPRPGDGSGWSVSYDVMVPSQWNLDLASKNGGVSVAGVHGRIAFSTTNGGIRLRDVNGDVKGSTVNGGVRVELSGAGWDGEGLDVETKNGGVQLTVPDGYSAHLETGTHNGGLRIAFPVTVQGDLRREIATDLGSGGAPIRLRTINGGVTVEKK